MDESTSSSSGPALDSGPLVWTEADSVGDPDIDREHKTWFEIVNRLGEAVEQGADPAVVEYTLAAVIEYTRVHFEHEEKRMMSARLPEFEAHKKIHDEFVQMMERMAALEYSPELVARLVRATRRWLVDHIRRVDQGYAGKI